jgi:hypothetical protein
MEADASSAVSFCDRIAVAFDDALANFLRVGYKVALRITFSREGCMKSVMMLVAFPARPLH